MGGPVSSPTAEIYMQAYERTAITTALHPPKVWKRFVDGIYSILKRTHSILKFTIKEKSNGKLAFLDTVSKLSTLK